jgi:hypothetical protein
MGFEVIASRRVSSSSKLASAVSQPESTGGAGCLALSTTSDSSFRGDALICSKALTTGAGRIRSLVQGPGQRSIWRTTRWSPWRRASRARSRASSHLATRRGRAIHSITQRIRCHGAVSPIWVRKPVDAEGPHIMLSGVGRRSCRRHESESSTWLNDTPRLLPTSSKHQLLPSRRTPMSARPPRLLLTRRVSQKRADVRDRKPPREGRT